MKRFFFSLVFTLFSLSTLGSIDDYFPSQPIPSSSNIGETGLLVMPNARFMEEGILKFGISSSFPQEFTSIVASPFPWMEATYRYTEIENKLYGPFIYSGNQSYKDKGFDIKLRLIKETKYLPSVAFGLRDIGGSGLTAAEYFVFSKRFGRLDTTLGLGFGALGSDANIRNPFISFHESFNYRNSDVGQGGNFNSKDWFSGQQVAAFGGLEYSFPKYGLSLKVEYDTSNPDIPFSNNLPLEVKSRFNAGLVYALGDWVDIGLSYERGTQWRFSFFFKGNYGKKFIVPKLDKPLYVVKLNEEQKTRIIENNNLFYRSLNLALREEKIYLQGASLEEGSVDIVIAQPRFTSYVRASGRAARITSALSPTQVKEITVYNMNGDIEIGAIRLNREEFDKAEMKQSSAAEVLLKSNLFSSKTEPKYQTTEFQPRVNFPEHFLSMKPAMKSQIGGPEAFYLGQLWWRIDSTLKFRRSLSLYTTLGLDIYNNFNQLNNPSQSTIPRVRSNIQDYLKEGANNIAMMKLEYTWSPKQDLYARFDIGLLEEMFGGYGGEILYRPFDKKYSLGMTLHKVKQRGFKQRFSFRDYETYTGFFEFYYDWPLDITSSIFVGKYLAGDKGVTLDLSRAFKTGFRVGIFATATDLSAEEFGEGSFDKGFYFAIPLDIFYPNYTKGNIGFGLHPLTKDGGAMLSYHNTLYGLTGDTNKASLIKRWNDLLD